MPEDEKKELTPEEAVAQAEKATAELEALKARFGKVTFTVNGKEHRLNLLDEGEFKKGQQFLAGGATFAQDKAAFNKEKAELDAKVKEMVEAELKARGQPHDATGETVDVDKLIEDSPELAQAVEDGDSKAFKTGLAKVLKEALKAIPRPDQPKTQGGPTNEYVDRRIAYNTRIIPDAMFQLLATKLGQGDTVVGAKMIAERYKDEVAAGKVDADADYATSFLSVAHSWAKDFGLKVEEPKPKEPSAEEAEHGKETPPKGGGAGGGPGAGPEPPTFKSHADVLKWDEEQKKKGGRQHSYLET